MSFPFTSSWYVEKLDGGRSGKVFSAEKALARRLHSHPQKLIGILKSKGALKGWAIEASLIDLGYNDIVQAAREYESDIQDRIKEKAGKPDISISYKDIRKAIRFIEKYGDFSTDIESTYHEATEGGWVQCETGQDTGSFEEGTPSYYTYELTVVPPEEQ